MKIALLVIGLMAVGLFAGISQVSATALDYPFFSGSVTYVAPATSGNSVVTQSSGDVSITLGGGGGSITATHALSSGVVPVSIRFNMQVPVDDATTNALANQNFYPENAGNSHFFSTFTQAGTTYMLDCNGLRTSFGDDLGNHAYILTVNLGANTYTVTKDGSSIGGTWSSTCYTGGAITKFTILQNYFGGAPNQHTRVIYTNLHIDDGVPNTLTLVNPPNGGSVPADGAIEFSSTFTGNTPDHVVYEADTVGGGPTYNCSGFAAPTFACTMNIPVGNYNAVAGSWGDEDETVFLAGGGTNAFTVIANPNSVTVTAPADGSTKNAGSISVASTVSGPGTVTSVQYTLNPSDEGSPGIDSGSCTGSSGATHPCTITGITHNGEYLVYATSFAGATQLAVSTPIHFRVINGIPQDVEAPAESLAVTDGIGFSVDPSGGTIITRENSGATVNTYAAGGAMPQLGTTETDCNRANAVFSKGTHVLYIQCDPDESATVLSYNIRSPSLGMPSQPNVCGGTVDCIIDIPDESTGGSGALAENHDPDSFMTGFEDFPIDYSNFQPGAFDVAVWLAFGYSTTNGELGVVTYVINHGLDYSAADVRTVGTQGLTAMCEIRDTGGATNGQSFLYGADSQSNVKGYRVTFTHDFNFVLNQHQMDPHLQEIFGGTTATSGPLGVGCGNHRLVIANSAQMTFWERGATIPYQTILLSTTPDQDGVEMSADGNWVALSYNGGLTVDVYNATSGDRVLHMFNGNVGIGAFVGMGWQGHGCNLWEMNANLIVRYDLVGSEVCLQDQTFVGPSGGNNGDTLVESQQNEQSGGVVAGSSCSQHYSGPIRIGFTYVPILDWSNCASMALETALTLIVMVGVAAVAQVRLANGQMSGIGPMILIVVAALAYMVSMYLWQAPLWFLVAAVAVGVAAIFLSRPGKAAGS